MPIGAPLSTSTPSCGKISVQIFQASSFAFLFLYGAAKGSDFGSLLIRRLRDFIKNSPTYTLIYLGYIGMARGVKQSIRLGGLT